MHLPVFLLFLCLTKCGVIKMVFMVLTAFVFSAPIVLVSAYCNRVIPMDSPLMLLVNLATCVVMLLLVFLIFRRGFHYLLKYGDNKLLALFCMVPLLYYIYIFVSLNIDFTGISTINWIILRTLTFLNVYVFYFLLLHNYRELSYRHELEAVQTAMKLELDAAEEQLILIYEAQRQSAVYHHDMRHHLTAIDGFLNARNGGDRRLGRERAVSRFLLGERVQRSLNHVLRQLVELGDKDEVDVIHRYI